MCVYDLLTIGQYSINKSQSLLGYGKDRRDQQVVAELDSAMNKWVDTVPNHCMYYAHDLNFGTVTELSPVVTP